MRMKRAVLTVRRAIFRTPRPMDRRPVPEGTPAIAGFSAKHLLKAGFERFESLDDPQVVPARAWELAPDELILGALLGQEPRMYPISWLWRHHIVNDRVGGVPLTLCY